ncbi:MAG: 3-oxoacyl-ACP reductase [Akkermansiaceae bacterium]|nr:3-oxoacyl-ACP reductase [Akkermansiaceae bacterium]
MTITLEGRRALVTGGSSGIGEAIARALGAAGAKVAVNCNSHPEQGEAVAQSIRDQGGQAFSVQADVSNPEAVAAMFKRLEAEWGGIDILVNNSGMDGKPAPVWEIDLESWRKVIEVNLFGAFHCAREALGRMVAQKSGVVLNITSVHEEIAWSGFSAYCASKAGVSMMTKTLAQEAAPYGVRVLALAPGAIKTPINKNVWDNPEGLKDLLNKIPLNRMGEASEIGNMAVVLVSDVAAYLTGRTVVVDGGMTDYPDFAHGG